MYPKVKRLVDRVKAHPYETYGEGIRRINLYGSYAKGEATQDCDIDVLVLVAPFLNPSEVRKSLSDQLFGIALEEGELVSVVAVSEDHYEDPNSPFMMNVRREGVPG
jgi:predicted nucleotidyltransferase